ncbi:antitoxin component of RelBE/YafQ-DinJ toxin-antitoxin module [Pedobacter sp. UYP30]|uniref:DUF2683 family protein n=1 Tax=Pedobacter sp. UYP30 TaxID=1756400 RepID=UPI00339968C0
MEALIFQPKNEEQLSALKAFAKAFKVPFRSESNVPNKQTIKAMHQLKAGKGISVKNVDELLKLI